MRRWGILAGVSFLILTGPTCSLTGEAADVLMYGSITDYGVVQRAEPSPSSSVLGTFDEANSYRELLVTGQTTAPDGGLWYRVESDIFGEGWMDEKSVDVAAPETALQRLDLEVRFACGITPALAEKKLGAPKRVDKASFDIPEYETVVETMTATYDGCELVFWDGILQSAAVTGETLSFGALTVGGDVQDLRGLLGEPTEKKGREWFFADEGMELLVTLDKAGKRIESFRSAMIMYE
ncbi:MAG TPA: hypothetical protein DIC53_07530 [Synergistaceae bacterium]|nr:hypothetical protein [Synergistaceae bacterium]